MSIIFNSSCATTSRSTFVPVLMSLQKCTPKGEQPRLKDLFLHYIHVFFFLLLVHFIPLFFPNCCTTFTPVFHCFSSVYIFKVASHHGVSFFSPRSQQRCTGSMQRVPHSGFIFPYSVVISPLLLRWRDFFESALKNLG